MLKRVSVKIKNRPKQKKTSNPEKMMASLYQYKSFVIK